MSTIAFFCIPAQGHTNPTLGVVRTLIARGHRVVYFSYEVMREKIEAAGAEFIACDEFDCEQKLTQKDRERIGSDMAFSMRVLVDTTLALDEMVCGALRRIRPDCVVADSMAIWGKAAALKLGIPLVMSTTTFAFNRYSSKSMRPSWKELLSSIGAMIRANREVKRLRVKGYPFKNVLDIIGSDDNAETIVYTSPEFQPASEMFSDKYAFVGPSIRPVRHPFGKRRDVLVYISMGTVNNDMVPFYRACLEALKDMDCQAVLSVGDLADISALEPLPENVDVFSFVDQMAVLQQADAFVTHCGMNSVNEALYYGVPLVTHPVTKEQTAVAVRAEELGAGLRLAQASAEGICEALNRVLSEPSYAENARNISDSFKRCSGAEGAADKILSVCGK